MTYPSGRSVTTGYDGAGRASGVSGQMGAEARTYASGMSYAAHGGLEQMTLGAKVEQWCFNNRMQPTAIRVGSAASTGCAAQAGDLLRLAYGYGTTNNNGNVLSQGIARAGFSASQSYAYDAFHRIKSVTEGSEYQNYEYSQAGNRWVGTTSANWSPGSHTPRSSDWYNAATNQLSNAALGIEHDAGNLKAIGQYGYDFDAENRMVVSRLNGVATNYSYDGEGRRVKKDATVFVYDAGGNLMAEYGGTASGVSLKYLTADHLGSTRLVVDASGAMAQCMDYLPFGEEITRTGCGAAGNGVAQKFTGKERDAETGLDYFGARYFSGAQGRFTSPDPVVMTRQRISDPQQWNLYAYVRNNPLMFVDPDGKELRLAVRNYSRYSAETVQRAAALAASRFSAAGVQNVSVDFRQGPPTAIENTRHFFTGVRAFVTGSERSHLAEVRPSSRGEGITNTDIKQGESGRNFGGSSAIDASYVEAKTTGVDAAVLGLANLMTHEIAHDVFVPHNEKNINDPMFRDARLEFLTNPNVQFSPSQAAALRKRFNTKEEQEAWERQQQSPGAQK